MVLPAAKRFHSDGVRSSLLQEGGPEMGHDHRKGPIPPLLKRYCRCAQCADADLAEMDRITQEKASLEIPWGAILR